MENFEKTYKNETVLNLLNEIYQLEMSGVNQYLHYSFMIMGHNRIPIQKWFRSHANDCLLHATEMGEKLTSLGGHPSLSIPKIEEKNNHSIKQLLEESLKIEEVAVSKYKKLISIATELNDISLEELARSYVKEETEHVDEVRKMLRSSGE